MTNYYHILGISPDASDEQIKAAYREKAKLLHPDLNDSPEAVPKFQLLGQAYACLIDSRKRKKYDLMFKYGMEYNARVGKEQKSHKDPKYRQKSATYSAYLHILKQQKIVKKDKHIVYFEYTMFISMLLIGISALVFAIEDFSSENYEQRKLGVTGLIFSISFLLMLIYGWKVIVRRK